MRFVKGTWIRDRRLLLVLLAFALFGLGAAVGAHLATAEPPTPRARPVSDAEAGVILQHALPDIGFRPKGLHRVGLSANPLDLPQDQVVLTYAIGTTNLAELTAFRAPAIARLEATGTERMTINGAAVDVSTRSVNRADRQWTFVTYTWSREGLSYALTVHLLEGLTRQEGDTMAASVK